MAKNISGDLQVVSANRLVDGVVVFLDDAGQWTPSLAHAAVAEGERAGAARIGLGECRGTVRPA